MNEKIEWVEIFGFVKHKAISDINPSDMLRIPNHVFIKIEVDQK